MKPDSQCSECNGRRVYRASGQASGGGYGPKLLPNLGPWYSLAKMDVLVCADCGLVRMYASRAAREKLAGAKGWERV